MSAENWHLRDFGEDLGDYIQDNYGVCALGRCPCLAPGVPWLGRACRHWIPVKSRNFHDLRSELRGR